MELCAPPTTVAMAGQNVTLLCPSSGVPTPPWVWSRDGQQLETGGRVTLLEGGASLHIAGAVEEDSGTYTCDVTNTIQSQVFSDTYMQNLDIQSEFKKF